MGFLLLLTIPFLIIGFILAQFAPVEPSTLGNVAGIFILIGFIGICAAMFDNF